MITVIIIFLCFKYNKPLENEMVLFILFSLGIDLIIFSGIHDLLLELIKISAT